MGEVGGRVVFRKVILWEAKVGEICCTGNGGRGVGLCGEEVDLQQLRSGMVCRRGSEMDELVGSWRL